MNIDGNNFLSHVFRDEGFCYALVLYRGHVINLTICGAGISNLLTAI